MINPQSFPIMKRFLSLCLLASVFGCFSAQAYDFYLKGVYYNKTSDSTVAVTYQDVRKLESNRYAYMSNVTIPETVTYKNVVYTVTEIGQQAFYNCREMRTISLPNTITSIGTNAFYNCTWLSSITIPNSVEKIAAYAFRSSDIVSIKIPASVRTIEYNAFQDCYSLRKVEFESIESLLTIDFRNYYANPMSFAGHLYFSDQDEEVTNLVIPDGITEIPNWAFAECRNVTSVSIPNTVKSIGRGAFYNCYNLYSLSLPNSLSDIGQEAFYRVPAKLCAEMGSYTLLGLWNSGIENVYDAHDTTAVLRRPTVFASARTQTTATLRIGNNYSEYVYLYQGEEVDIYKGITLTNLNPETTYTPTVIVCKSVGDETARCVISGSYETRELFYYNRPFEKSVTASSLRVKGQYIPGDAKIKSESLTIANIVYDTACVTLTGLEPEAKYNVIYTITLENGKQYSRSQMLTLSALNLTTLQPKVVSEGNVIVQAQANVDEEEQNVGFEWRRTDWDDTFASSTANGYAYDGVVEGYIRNMNASHLWKYRACYQSNSGKQYYGDWVGIDPGNTSYFEPTVHTYAQVSVNANTAHLKGYAQRGTDRIEAQGFIYWKSGAAATEIPSNATTVAATEIPSNATTVAATGTLMETTLQALDFNSQYTYVAFVRTSEGETFYGAEQTFSIGEDPDGVVSTAVAPTASAVPVAIYDLRGHRLPDLQKGINIIRYSDGSAQKILVK